MKVNISGRGIIPGMGVIPPVYGKDMSEKEVSRLLNFESLRVYDSQTGLLITKKNISKIFSNNTVSTPVETVTLPHKSDDIVETTVLPYTSEKPTDVVELVKEETKVDEESNKQSVIEEESTEEDITDEIVSEEKTDFTDNNYNNKNRNKNKKHK